MKKPAFIPLHPENPCPVRNKIFNGAEDEWKVKPSTALRPWHQAISGFRRAEPRTECFSVNASSTGLRLWHSGARVKKENFLNTLSFRSDVTGFILAIIITGILFAGSASAHNPRIVPEQCEICPSIPVVEIKNPEISQAFYGELKGQPQWFEFAIDKKFQLYVNILQPKIPEAKKNISVEIYWDGHFIAWLDADNMKWTEFHEPFGGDDYWQGEEYKREEWAGLYRIKVYNKDNQGKYSLAIGSQEKFSPREILKTIYLLPTLKKDFFDKSPLTAYFNYIGLFILGALVIMATVVFLAIWIVRKSRKKASALPPQI